MKIYVAIPVYDGKLQVQTVKCLLDEQRLALGVGDVISVSFLPSCSVPAHGRNRLVGDFLKTDFDRLIFLDADITFEPGDLVKLSHMPVDFVGGAYRYKNKVERYPVGFIPGEMWTNKLGLMEVETIPTGFTSFSRNIFEVFKNKYKDRYYIHQDEKQYCFFQMVFADGFMHSDDSWFCKEWRKIGGKVYLDPEISLTHWDFNIPYPGHIGKFLKSQIQPQTKDLACQKTTNGHDGDFTSRPVPMERL